MSTFVGKGLSVLFGFSSGMVIATAILAFISAISIIPRIAEKTDTRSYFLEIGTAAVLGTVVGSLISLWEVEVSIPNIIISLFGLCIGIFTGCLSVAVAEVLNVIPIAKKRIKIKRGMRLVLLFFAIGKMIGSLYYWFYPGFIR